VSQAPLLPTVDLKGITVSPGILQRISLETMQRFQVAAFNETEKELSIALVYPERLKQGFFSALKDMEDKVRRTIKLYKTDLASLEHLLEQYPSAQSEHRKSEQLVPQDRLGRTEQMVADQSGKLDEAHNQGSGVRETGTLPKGTLPTPPLFKLGQSVALNYLRRVPLDYAKEHRIACVDFFPPNTYWFLSDMPQADQIKRLVAEIEKSNGIKAHLLAASAQELSDILQYYDEQENSAQEKAQQEQKKLQKDLNSKQDKPLPASVEPEIPVGKDVTVPDLQATILSTQEERPGIAGLFQRISNTIGASRQEGDAAVDSTVTSEEGESHPAPAQADAPSTGISSRSAALPVAMVRPATSSEAAAPAAPVSSAAAPAPSQGSGKSGATPITEEDQGDIGKLLDKEVASVDALKEHVRKGFIPRIVAAVVSYAIHEKASDIHIEAFEDEVRIRYRVDGQLLDIVKLPPDVHAAMVSRIKILSRLRLDENRVPQDGRFDVNFDHAQVDLRVSVMPTVHGEKVVMRILDKSKGITSLEKLGIEGLGYQNLMKAIQRPFGVCLATGPTGSGKSTSLYAILNRIATPNVNVVTLEDPVEYEMKGINQAQIRPKIGFTFADGLRSVLRQDPNIIMVGEIRDGETANMATQAALTGHLVLSTLHTNDAAGAIPRLTNMGIEPFLITSALNVAIGQRLVRKICPHCRKEVTLPPGFRNEIESDLAVIAKLNQEDLTRLPKEMKFYQGMGCDQCGGKGYQGRLGIYEVLTMSETIEELTLRRAPTAEIQSQAQKEGMLTMYQDGLIKVVNGTTTLDEVLRETANH
jgi:type IV pilus assembly protein PilB